MTEASAIKLARKLNQKKYRRQTGLFIAEGRKIIAELIKSPFNIKTIIATEDAMEQIPLPSDIQIITTDQQTINKISQLKTPQPIMAIVEQLEWPVRGDEAIRGLVLALDNIQDPGNMGTILRLADWFGVELVVASSDTVDVYNPKVVQASMGSLFRVPVVYTDLVHFLSDCQAPIYGTTLDGEPIDQQELSGNAVLVMGNEAHGLRQEIKRLVTLRLFIPSFRQGEHAESLNVATATAIVLWEFRRRK